MRSLLFVVVAGVASPSFAEEVTLASIRELMDRYGFTASLADFGEAFKVGVQQSAGDQIPVKLAEKLGEIGAEELDGQVLLEMVEGAFVSGISENELDALNVFVTSHLGARITALEIAAHSPEATQQVLENQDELLDKVKNDPALAAWLERIDRAIYASDIGATASFTLSYAMILGIGVDADPEFLSIALNELESSRDEMRDDISKSMIVFFAWTYNGLSDDEREQYALFLESRPARQLYGLYHEQIVEFFRVGGAQIGQKLIAWTREREG